MARDPVGHGVHGDRQLLGGQRELEAEVARRIGDQSGEHCPDLGKALGDLGAHRRIAHRVGPELHQQEHRPRFALDEAHPVVRAAASPLVDGPAVADRLFELSRARV